MRRVESGLRPARILVNNAALYAFVALDDLTSECCRRMFDVNILGVILASQQAARQFGPAGGSICNISWIAATTGAPNCSIYAADKGAMDASRASSRPSRGPARSASIRSHRDRPDTEGFRAGGHYDSDWRKGLEAVIPLGRTGLPGDIAPAVVFLASDDASWLTVENINISGGMR